MSYHGIMFHHFHNDEHPRGQGAISSETFEALLHRVGLDRILSAEDWLRRHVDGTLEPQHVCLTFDDNLRCQFDVALPVMERLDLTGFWFVYTSVLSGATERLEVYRYFRSSCFPSVDDFYAEFFVALGELPTAEEIKHKLRDWDISSYLSEYPMYTYNDRKFRLLRDQVLGESLYNNVMDTLLSLHSIDLPALHEKLWMNAGCLRELKRKGNIVGLHSSTHPTMLGNLSYEKQLAEYCDNAAAIRECLGESPIAMSHPCNSYNEDTLSILSALGVKLGFRANTQKAHGFSALEVPRRNHMDFVLKDEE